MRGLILHAGANAATLDQVTQVPTPEPTETWYPIPHRALIDTVARNLEGSGFRVADQAYGLFSDGARMFGVLGLDNGRAHPDYRLTLGIRNAHDKSFSAGFACGSSVFVCDNLAFSSEIVIARKHTRFIMRDLDRLVAESIGKLGAARDTQDRRIAAYKRTTLTEIIVHDVLIRSVDAKVMANSYIAKVLEEWRNPQHDEFAPRTAWSLFNAYTEVFKGTNPLDLPQRTERLHGLLDLVSVQEGHDPAQIVLEAPEPAQGPQERQRAAILEDGLNRLLS